MGGNEDLRHSEAAKKAAARYVHEHLGPETHKAGILADDGTEKVTGAGADELQDWDIASGLRRRHSRWERHFTHLETRLQQEQTGLQQANRLIGDTDHLTGDALGSLPLENPDGTVTESPLYRSRIADY
ncbi:hypothetical protein [Streptomyces daliensis]|uniref:Uncharacterized protein n=1 Tax=Streptomyces daliensis TaxID=299421 RepID=A0A8T4IP77_9ACTN|nr:hypothetical protein [Streptomyces daliensis]